VAAVTAYPRENKPDSFYNFTGFACGLQLLLMLQGNALNKDKKLIEWQ
jgi:hypothetical protein